MTDYNIQSNKVNNTSQKNDLVAKVDKSNISLFPWREEKETATKYDQ